MKPSTFSSATRICIAACWYRTIASNDVPSAASVVPRSWSWSSLGMNPLGTICQSTTVPSQDEQAEHECGGTPGHHPGQGALVERERLLVASLEPGGGLLHPAGLAAVLRRLEEAAAEHRRERQRHEGRHQDRHRDGDGELAEEPADNAAKEQQRNEDRHQRQGHRENGEADLLRPVERRLHRASRPFPCGGRCSPASRWRRPPRSPPRASAP